MGKETHNFSSFSAPFPLCSVHCGFETLDVGCRRVMPREGVGGGALLCDSQRQSCETKMHRAKGEMGAENEEKMWVFLPIQVPHHLTNFTSVGRV